MHGVFVTATGTEVGKTWVSTGLTRALRERGVQVAAIKPIETGCEPEARDATALATACGRTALADAQGLYRARPPLAPYAVERLGGPAVGALAPLRDRVLELAAGADLCLVEGAGGVLVPIDQEHAFADLMTAFGFPAIVVAANVLGVQSYTLTAIEALQRRGISVLAVVLNQVDPAQDDLSRQSNADVLRALLPGIPVFEAAYGTHSEALVAHVHESVLSER